MAHTKASQHTGISRVQSTSRGPYCPRQTFLPTTLLFEQGTRWASVGRLISWSILCAPMNVVTSGVTAHRDGLRGIVSPWRILSMTFKTSIWAHVLACSKRRLCQECQHMVKVPVFHSAYLLVDGIAHTKITTAAHVNKCLKENAGDRNVVPFLNKITNFLLHIQIDHISPVTPIAHLEEKR